MRALNLTAAAAALILAGCAGPSRQPPVQVFPDMRHQGRYDPQAERPFFSDQRASRRPVEGTIARGRLKDEDAFFTGIVNNQYVGKNPVKLDEDVMHTGQRRFNTYCAPCHDRTGTGRGVVGQRAIWIPTNLHEPRVLNFNDGEIYSVITQGRRSMPSYRFQITENDRWAIVAYVRALQRTQQGTMTDVPEDQKAGLK